MSANEPQHVEAERPDRGEHRFQRAFARSQGALIAAGLLLVLLAIYQVQTGGVLSAFQVRVLVNGGMATVFASLGLAIVVITGGLDLSVGAIMGLVNVLAATLLTGRWGTDLGVIVLLLLVGALAGAINGWLVAVVGLQSIIVTLATMFIWFGVSLLLMPQPGGSIPEEFSDLLTGQFFGLPVASLWLLVTVAVVLAMRETRIHAAIFAVGSDDTATFRSGVSIVRTRLIAYSVAGLLYAIGGLFLSAQTTGGDANIGSAFLLTSFAAVVLGGTPLGGGKGTLIGAIIGAFIVTILGTVLLSIGVTSYMTDIVQGGILVAAVVLPTLVGRVVQRHRRTDRPGRRPAEVTT